MVGQRAALTPGVRSATVTALDEVSAMVVPAERFAEFLRGHPRAAEVLERRVTERREEDRMRLFPGERAGAERRLAWLLLDLAQRRGGYQATVFTLPMSQTELADWAGTSADAVGRFLRSWRDRGIVARSERPRRLTVVDLDGPARCCWCCPAFAPATPIPAWLLQLPPLAELLADRTVSPAGKDNGAERRGLRAGLQGLSRTGLIEIATASGGPAGLNAVTVHPVVADANRIRLAASADAEHAAVQGTAVALLEAATAGLDPARPGDWPTWRLLRPHVNAAIDLLADDLDPAILTRLLMVSAVGTEALLGAGRLAAAEKLAQASVVAATFLSRDDPAAMTARGYLARTLVRRGRSGDAETIYRDLLADRLRIQGEDHLDTLTSRATLARLAARQGRRAEAEELYRQVIADRTRVLGASHPDTASVRTEFAQAAAP